jgi:hypothetical protein
VEVEVALGQGAQVTGLGARHAQHRRAPLPAQALKAGSPAIDTGPDPVPSFPGNEFDQRGAGFARVVGGRVDVGAFEVQDVTPAPLVITPRFTG